MEEAITAEGPADEAAAEVAIADEARAGAPCGTTVAPATMIAIRK